MIVQILLGVAIYCIFIYIDCILLLSSSSSEGGARVNKISTTLYDDLWSQNLMVICVLDFDVCVVLSGCRLFLEFIFTISYISLLFYETVIIISF